MSHHVKETAAVEKPVTEEKAAPKKRRATGPREQRPVQIVASVVDGKPFVYVATKDELVAAKALTAAIRNGDHDVESFSVKLT